MRVFFSTFTSMRFLFSLLLVCSWSLCFGQNELTVYVNDSITQEALPGAIVEMKNCGAGGATDSEGKVVLKPVPEGNDVVVVRYTGYKSREVNVSIPAVGQMWVVLAPENAEMEEVIIEGTRSNKSIADEPSRVEVLTEEIDEASTMDPSKIAHLITHSTGIQVQQTSAVSNSANVRIQGLDGRYTQILKDGFPLYGGFSGSLSIMQIPPLDLRQVEYIKGGSSTLYGGGAIAGMINLISKEPTDEMLFHINASHIGAFDMNTYVARRTERFGFTLLAQRNSHHWFDADSDGYSDMPQLTKYNLNPKLFFYFPKTTVWLGATFTDEKRQGGDVNLMNSELPTFINYYMEKNSVQRITTQFKLQRKLNNSSTLTLKNSFNIFNRSLMLFYQNDLPPHNFSGRQLSSFSEATYTRTFNKNVWIAGLNYYTDDFMEDEIPGWWNDSILLQESYQTAGAFTNLVWNFGKKVIAEGGLRGDYVVTTKKFIVLPRISVLFKWTDQLTTRINAGMGYRNATVFNPEAESWGYQYVKSIDNNLAKAEQSFGGGADIAWKFPIGENFFVMFNQMFFYSRVEKPLVLTDTALTGISLVYMNANGYTESYGGETFFKFGFYDFVLFVGYTYTDVNNHFADTVSVLPLTPKHSLKGDLLYALPGKWRIGLDYEYKSEQNLSSGRVVPSYWTFGAVVEYTWTNFTFFGNVENYTDVRQTKYASIPSSPGGVRFAEVWAPLDGIVVNAGIKFRLSE